MAADAVLDTSNERGRLRVRGREEIVAHLSGPGPGEVVHWDAREWESGAAITFEWRGPEGPDRRRWYVRREGEEISSLNSYAARPRSSPAEDAQIPAEVLARLGPGARREPLEHAGNSGAALERVVLGDGTRLIAKRVGPGADWLGRVTRDRGRTALAVGGRGVRADAGRARPRHRVRDRRWRRLVGGHARPLGHLPRRGPPALALGGPAHPRRRGGDARRVLGRRARRRGRPGRPAGHGVAAGGRIRAGGARSPAQAAGRGLGRVRGLRAARTWPGS